MSNPTDPTDPASYSGYADPAAPTRRPAAPSDATDLSRVPGRRARVPRTRSGGGAPVLLTMGDMSITQFEVITPYGSHPLNGSTWYVTDNSTYEQAVPQWAIIAAIVGFFLVCALSLLFLLVKETKASGSVQITVQGPGWSHVTQLPPGPAPTPAAGRLRPQPRRRPAGLTAAPSAPVEARPTAASVSGPDPGCLIDRGSRPPRTVRPSLDAAGAAGAGEAGGGPPARRDSVDRTGHRFHAGGEPDGMRSPRSASSCRSRRRRLRPCSATRPLRRAGEGRR